MFFFLFLFGFSFCRWQMQVALCLVFWLKLLLVLFLLCFYFCLFCTLSLFHLTFVSAKILHLILGFGCFCGCFLVFHYHSINNNNKNVINGVAVVAACAPIIRQLRLAPGHTSSTSSSSDADVFISLCYLSNAITAIASCARTPQP